MDIQQEALKPALRDAFSLSPADWEKWCEGYDIPRFRARQIWHELYWRLAPSWDAMPVIPVWLRSKLAAEFNAEPLRTDEVLGTPDGVRKFLFSCADGQHVETVLIPASGGRRTVCVSSQVGCAFGCAFCASGKGGCVRSLESGEIVAQAVAVARLLAQSGERLSNVVVMGMGEPMANYDNVIAALRTLNNPDGLGIGARRITISTCGVVPGIRRLATEGMQFELSVSLHAPDSELRSRIMPVNDRWPLDELMAACHDYTEATGRIITFEYTLVGGMNASPAHARRLATLLAGRKCRVNLIPLSPVEEFEGRAPTRAECEGFQRILEEARINVTLRNSRGGGVSAACGQLRRTRENAGAAQRRDDGKRNGGFHERRPPKNGAPRKEWRDGGKNGAPHSPSRHGERHTGRENQRDDYRDDYRDNGADGGFRGGSRNGGFRGGRRNHGGDNGFSPRRGPRAGGPW